MEILIIKIQQQDWKDMNALQEEMKFKIIFQKEIQGEPKETIILQEQIPEDKQSLEILLSGKDQ